MKSLVFWLTCVFCLTASSSSVVSHAEPTIAPLDTTHMSEAVKINEEEGVFVKGGNYMDRVTGNVLQNFSSPQGEYSFLVRNDLGRVFIYYNIDNKPFCYPLTITPAPTPLPRHLNTAGLKFVKETVAPNGKLAYEVGLSVERYTFSFLLDVETGLPVFGSSQLPDGTVNTQTHYVNGSIDGSVFRPPSYCNIGKKSGGADLANYRYEDLVNPMTGEILPRHFRRIPSTPRDLRQYHEEDVIRSQSIFLANHGHGSLVQELPTHVDNRVYATPVRNQGWCGACWGFSTAAATEVAYRKAYNLSKTYNVSSWFSVQNLIDCVHPGYNNGSGLFPCKGCEGGWPITAFDYIVANGIEMDSDYHYDAVTGNSCRAKNESSHFPLKSAYSIPSGNVTAMMEAVHKHGSFVGLILFYPGNAYYTHGIYDNPACTPGLSHAVAVVGYGTEDGKDYWLVKNSLGTGWGEGGYFRIVRGVNMCGIEDYAFVPVAN